MASKIDAALSDTLPDKEIEEQQRTAQDDIYIDPEAEKALLRKLDRWIVPPVMLLYLLSFLDRVNIGNARLYGMEEDLGLTGDQYQIAVSVLFVTYILSELPSNLVIKKFTPSRWIAFITTAWGVVATLTGIVQNYKSLVACRVILGALEGGLFPGLTIYLTMFYTKREYALRIGYLFSSDQMHKEDVYAGLKDWKIWLFCIGQFGGDVILYGYSTFLPTIIRGLGDWSIAQVQALTIPCYALGAISYIVVAWLSDRSQRRAVFTVIFGLVCTTGYAVLVSTAPGGVKYFGCLLAQQPSIWKAYGRNRSSTDYWKLCWYPSPIFVQNP
ncbi:hypothetical protein LRP88_11628 [Fusarium phalaenopsidis]